jgi:hypothetical protein
VKISAAQYVAGITEAWVISQSKVLQKRNKETGNARWLSLNSGFDNAASHRACSSTASRQAVCLSICMLWRFLQTFTSTAADALRATLRRGGQDYCPIGDLGPDRSDSCVALPIFSEHV